MRTRSLLLGVLAASCLVSFAVTAAHALQVKHQSISARRSWGRTTAR